MGRETSGRRGGEVRGRGRVDGMEGEAHNEGGEEERRSVWMTDP